jgi:hypothetical protein
MTKLHKCQECGDPISARRQGQEFCKPACRQTFNNRRMQRGAELYDLFRALRRERADAKGMNLWTEICRLELNWQIEDEAKDGRFLRLKAIPVLWDAQSNELLVGTSRLAAS